MPRPLKWGILGAGTIILPGDIHNFILCMVRIFMNQTLLGVNIHVQNDHGVVCRLVPCIKDMGLACWVP